MTGERKIVGIRPPKDGIAASAGSADTEIPAIALEVAEAPPPAFIEAVAADDWVGDNAETLPLVDTGSRLLGWAIHLGVLLWIGLTLWVATNGFAGLLAPTQWVEIGLSVLPPLVLWALAMLVLRRISSRTHAQQVKVLQQLRSEYAALDDSLQAMHTHWRDADQQLQSRAAALSGFGLDTAARLHDASQGIEATMQRSTAASAALAERSEAAKRQLDSLALAVPKLEEITARLSDNLRQAGQSAYQFGGQLEAQIANIGVEAATAGAALSEASDALAERVVVLASSSEQAQATLASGTAMLGAAAEQQRDQALVLLAEFAASASEATSQSAAQIAAAREAALAQLERDSAGLQALLAQVNGAANDLQAALSDAATSSTDLQSALANQVQSMREQLAAVEAEGRQRMATLNDALTLLSDGMETFRERAAAGDEQAVALIQRAETLLIALDSATREIDETVPAALTRLSGHAESAEATVARLGPLTQTEGERVAEIEARLNAVSATLEAQQQRMAALGSAGDEAVAARRAELEALEVGLSGIEGKLARLTDGPMADFTARLAAVEQDAGATLGRTEEAVNRLVSAASEQAATDIGAAIDRVAGAGINERLAAMSAHADQAVAAAAAASDRLMRQLITIADSSAALEQRAQEVSALSAGVERETLARQMALLGEALQSTAVDLTRILDMDVADQAWDAYLKGDRSIFARRAAKLLSYTEARDLLRRYESDDAFKAQVNRYIHDFEAMLRGVMDTRDGHALSVILLSSDIGKLYVALAQAIERLRR